MPRPARTRPRQHAFHWASLVLALTVVGSPDEAMAAAAGLIEGAEGTKNKYLLAFAFLAYGYAVRDTDPICALEAQHRSLVITRDTGNRFNESNLALVLARLRAEHGDTASAFEHHTLATRNFHDAGNTTLMRNPLAILAALFHTVTLTRRETLMRQSNPRRVVTRLRPSARAAA